jgi:regulation of enolase protein 1 (concanavalin A-like superfamily)
MYKKLFYLAVILLLLAVNAMVQAEVFIDDFNTPHIYYDPNTNTHDVTGTIWDDFIGWYTGETVTDLSASHDRPGQLFISSVNGTWDAPWDPLGPFLFKVIKGDFIATVQIADYAGTEDAPVFHNDGGLMARAFKSPDDAGPGEDWVSIDYFPIWTCGNFHWNADNDVRYELGHNAKAWDADRYLQLERNGNIIHVRTSPDGVTWTEMATSPVTRDDLSGLRLQVGLRQTTYFSGDWGYVAFDDFRLETFVNLKARFPVPADGGTATPTALQWVAGDYAAEHDVYLGTSFDDVSNATASTPELYKGRQANTAGVINGFTVTGLIPGETYYWRIDEVNDTHPDKMWKGDVWSFTPVPFKAWQPGPSDGAECVSTHAILSWSPGAKAAIHDVYFGTNLTNVSTASRFSKKSVLVSTGQSGTTYTPTLALDTTYYWRIDEVNLPNNWKGDVWSFTTGHSMSIAEAGLVGWWKLDGTDCVGAAIDSSGYDYHGTLVNGPQWLPGYDNDALQFDGRDDYVELPIGSLIGSLTNSTFMLWLDSQPGGSWSRAFDFGTTDPNVYMCLGPRWWFMDDMYFAITTSGADNQILVQPTGFDIETGWQHVAVTINADKGTMILYYNGEELAQTTGVTLSPKDLGNTTNNWLGRSHQAADSYFLGSMDDFRIYNYALSETQIERAMLGDPRLAWHPYPADGAVTDVEKALPLSWTPGEQAAQHDVYLGTDKLAVKSADTSDTTGIYRGRHDPNSYTPPEGVEPNQVYYWRIDEVNNDGTISIGKIWSFTVAAYLIVDDFEDYDDLNNRIYDTWSDYYVNNTGMTVGHLEAPFAEQTIVHSGSQSMYMHYDNDGTVNEGTSYEQSGTFLYSEVDRQWEVAQDWTRKGADSLTLWFQGVPASVGSFTAGPPITMTARGVDIWGTADQFHFAYKRLSGEGSVTARVVSITGTNPWAKAGVMIRNSLDAGSAHAIVVVTPGNGVAFEYRSEAGGDSLEEALQNGVTAPQWVRLTRSGNNFTAEYSTNGTSWQPLGLPITIPMLADVYVGLCLTSHNVNATCTAEFSNVTLPTSATGQWQSQDIGIASNIGEQLYVVLQDSTGNSVVIKHPDPAATTIGTWTEWNIPLTDFTGVNLQAVKNMSIGVGDRANPQAGGSGTLYIDDIWLNLP